MFLSKCPAQWLNLPGDLKHQLCGKQSPSDFVTCFKVLSGYFLSKAPYIPFITSM